MALLRKSLSHDAIDHISQIWSFLFVLLLSFVFLLIPLSPSMKLEDPQPVELPTQEVKIRGHTFYTPKHQEYRAICWTPPQFTSSMVLYTNSICASALNAAIQGRNSSQSTGAASIYKLRVDEIIPVDTDNIKITTIDDLYEQGGDDHEESSNSMAGMEDALRHIERDTKVLNTDLRLLVSLKAPLYLFLIAVCLQLPYGVWSLISTCCGHVNIDQTLSFLQSSPSTNSTTRDRLTEVVGKSSQKSSALTYLLLKFLMVVVLCILLVVVHGSLLSQADKIEGKVDAAKVKGEMITNHYLSSQKNPNMKGTSDKGSGANMLMNEVLFCDINIRQLQNIETYTFQCAFSLEERQEWETSAAGNHGNKGVDALSSTLQHQQAVVLLYKALFTFVLVLLALLVVFNVISLVTWLIKFAVPSCKSGMGLHSESSMDAAFLVAMAWANASGTVAMEVAKYFGKSKSHIDNDGGTDGESTNLN